MVFDGYRNAAYFRALEKVATSDSTVLDLGAGLGVHGLNAAALGVAAVHLVEPLPIIELARNIAADNDLGNVHCHECRADEMQLEAPVDILVSVFTGNFLLTEDLLPSLFNARDRFLKPGGQMIPDRGRMQVVPVSAADYYQKYIGQWDDYAKHASEHAIPQLDHRGVRRYAANSLYYDRRKKFDSVPLASPADLAELDFATAISADCDSQIDVRVERDGPCHGWLGWFQIHLVDEWFSTSGDSYDTHWCPVFLPLERPIEVTAGEELNFSLKRPEFGDWTWTTTHRGTRQRQSTFLSKPLSLERVHKTAEDYQPCLNQRGEAALWVLAKMAGEFVPAQLASELNERFPAVFVDRPDALAFVINLVEDYS